VVFVAKIAEAKEKKGKIELVLLEQAMSSDSERVLAGAASGTVSSSSGSGSAAWRSNGFAGSGSASGNTSSSSMSASGVTETRVTDVFEDTGQEIIAKIKQSDPFLKVDKNMVFLVRFDSALVGDTSQLGEGEEPQRTALVTLISYHDM
jgi:hypothetical protein